jgi:hypothetical protein
VWLARLWPGWQDALEFVQPRTVLAWHKKRFRDYWRRLSQSGKPGRPAISKEVRDHIQDMWRANPTWGSPRIVGELRRLSITVSKSTVEKYRPKPSKPPSPTWKAFLANHVPDLMACDFFTVPTATFKILFGFILLAHDRRRIVHVNVTEHPTAEWTAQQIVEAFPWQTAPRYLLRDRDSIYGAAFQSRIHDMGIEEVKIAPRSRWQNPYFERVIQAATNKSEAFNRFVQWLFFGEEAIITSNDRAKQRQRIKYNHLIANCLIFHNAHAQTWILHDLAQEGYTFDKAVFESMSPYLRGHVNRFGSYALDFNRQVLVPDYSMPVWVPSS